MSFYLLWTHFHPQIHFLWQVYPFGTPLYLWNRKCLKRSRYLFIIPRVFYGALEISLWSFLFAFGSRILMRTWELFTMELNIQPCYSITRSSFCLSVGSTLEQIRTLGKWHFSQHWCLNTSRIWELIKAMLEPLFSADKIACQVSSFSMNETGGQFAWSLISFPPVHKTGLTAQVCVFHLNRA